MKRLRVASVVLLLVVFGSALAANLITSVHYATQFRDEVPNASPSKMHWLGTDDLGRDRLSRALYGTRVSLLLAPAAAFLSTMLAGLIGVIAGYRGGWIERFAMAITDLFLSLPWLFLLLSVRAMMPLNVSPLTSVMVTFLMLGLLGWAASARVVCAGAKSLKKSDFILLARASGISTPALVMRHVLPNIRPVLIAQFFISVPVFILSEANLGILGLGVAEPLPSWGSLLRELETLTSSGGEYWKLVPLALLIVVITAFQILVSDQKEMATS